MAHLLVDTAPPTRCQQHDSPLLTRLCSSTPVKTPGVGVTNKPGRLSPCSFPYLSYSARLLLRCTGTLHRQCVVILMCRGEGAVLTRMQVLFGRSRADWRNTFAQSRHRPSSPYPDFWTIPRGVVRWCYLLPTHTPSWLSLLRRASNSKRAKRACSSLVSGTSTRFHTGPTHPIPASCHSVRTSRPTRRTVR